jgi:Tfp pilus assembly protein PilF
VVVSDLSEQIAKASALSELGQVDAAERVLIACVSEGVSDASWHQARGVLEIRRERNEAAEEAFQETIRLEPDRACHWHNLAFSVVNQGEARAPEALGLINRALELDPNDGDLHLLAARILVAAGDARTGARSALRALDEAERLGTDGAYAAVTRVWIYERCENRDAAMRAAVEGLELYPNDSRLRTRYAALLGQGASAQAEAGALLRSTLAADPTNAMAREELLRRLQLLMVRSRYAVLVAQILAGVALILPRPAPAIAAAAGLAATLAFLGLDRRTARRLAGAELVDEYLAGHPGLRVGRQLQLVAAVCAWVPALVGGVIPGTPPLVMAALVSVPLGTALAWIGGGLAVRSAASDADVEDFGGSARLTRIAWREARIGKALHYERWATTLSMLPLGVLSALLPQGFGMAAVAAAAGAIMAAATDGYAKVAGVFGMRRASAPAQLRADARAINPFVLVVVMLSRQLVVIFLATGAMVFGWMNVSGHQATPQDEPAPGRPSLVVPSIPRVTVPSTFELPSITVPSLEVPPVVPTPSP